MKEQLIKILAEIRPEVDFSSNNRLIDDGILDSFDIVTLVGELNESFEIEIGAEDLLPSNFNSINAMLGLITRIKNEE